MSTISGRKNGKKPVFSGLCGYWWGLGQNGQERPHPSPSKLGDTFPKGEGKINQPPAAAPKPPKEPVRRLCRGLRPQRGQFKQSSATRAAPNAAAFPTVWNPNGGLRGEAQNGRFPPAAFRRFRRAKAATYSLHPAATKERTTTSSPTRGNFIPSTNSGASASARCATSPSAWCTASAHDRSPPSGGRLPPGPPAPPATGRGSARCRTGCG